MYEPVTPEYGWGKYGEFKVLIRRRDGYINATKLCALGGKELFNYNANKSSQRFIDEAVLVLGIPKIELIQELNGGNIPVIRGTYIHQDLVPHIACWISPRFAVNVSRILRQWRALSRANEETYWQTLGDCVTNYPSADSNQEEKKWQQFIADRENAQTEAKVKGGRVDVLSDSNVIEVKRACDWKHALGQVLVYSQSFEDRVPWICLFGVKDDLDREYVVEVCYKLGVEVEFIE